MRRAAARIDPRSSLAVAILIVPLLTLGAPSASADRIHVRSIACAYSGYYKDDLSCYEDAHDGNPAVSDAGKGVIFVDTTYDEGGYNFGARADATGVPGGFSLYAHSAGSSDGAYFGTATASGIVEFYDSITVAGGGRTGAATIRIPWLVEGAFDISGNGSGAFGVNGCGSIATGARSGGQACSADFTFDRFTGPEDYSKIWYLDYQIQLDVAYDINTIFGVSTSAGGARNNGGIATGDFVHTGLQQAAQVFDSDGNLLGDVSIASASGLDYLDPQADLPGDDAAAPEPATLALLGSGLAGLGLMRRRRARQPA